MSYLRGKSEMFAKILEKQNKLLEMLAQHVNYEKVPEPRSDITEFIIVTLVRNIVEFVPDPENMITFDSWCKRYEVLI